MKHIIEIQFFFNKFRTIIIKFSVQRCNNFHPYYMYYSINSKLGYKNNFTAFKCDFNQSIVIQDDFKTSI